MCKGYLFRCYLYLPLSWIDVWCFQTFIVFFWRAVPPVKPAAPPLHMLSLDFAFKCVCELFTDFQLHFWCCVWNRVSVRQDLGVPGTVGSASRSGCSCCASSSGEGVSAAACVSETGLHLGVVRAPFCVVPPGTQHTDGCYSSANDNA